MVEIDQEQITRAVELLTSGEVVAFPTETVYGLGADATNPEALNKVFSIKGRPTNHPLIVHIPSAEYLRLWVREVPESAEKLAEKFWPGALTIILARNGRVADEAVGSKPTIALRVPDHPLALALLEKFDGGLAGPSANRFGSVSPTSAQHVLDDLGNEIKLILDGGKCKVGVESTIIDLTGHPEILRPGGIDKSAIEDVLGEKVLDGSSGESRAPGMMNSHYAPKANIILVSAEELQNNPELNDVGVGVISPFAMKANVIWTMPEKADEYARSLYAVLREADLRGIQKLFVVPPEDGSLLEAVLDRLAKASAPKN